jgi:hypothetical protein
MRTNRLLTTIIVAALMTMAAATALAQTNHSGDITANETWYASGNPHIVTADVRVFAAAGSCTLKIMPGVFVKFDSSTVLQIGTATQEGVLMALGTADSTVFFGSNMAEPAPGDWQGIHFHIDSGGHLDYCLIKQGGHGPLKANLTLSQGAEPIIAHCTIEESAGYGLVCGDGARPTVMANTFQNNELYPVQVYGNEVPLIQAGNIFTGKGPKAIKVLGDVISSSAVWPLHAVSYVIAGDLEVSKSAVGDTLTLQPGTRLRFKPGVTLRIGSPGSPGYLSAAGDTNAIVFTAADTAKAPHWAGLYFSSQGSGFLDGCEVAFGGAGARMANIYCATASAPVIQNCTIEKSSGHGLVCADAALPTVTGNTFQHNGAHPISIFANYVPLVDTSNAYADNMENAIELKGDNITSTVTWPDLGIPFALAGDVSVFSPSLGDTLTLQPGVTLAFDPQVQLRVGGSGFPGTLLAGGLPGSVVTFTSGADTVAPGDWADIFCDSLGTAWLEHCVVEYGGGSSHDANIYVTAGGILTLNSCTVRYSDGDGISCWGSDSVQVAGSLITGNQIGIHCYGCQPVVKHNQIADNAIYGFTNDTDEVTVDATGNWWGHPSGPQDTSPGPPSYNPAGQGDRVTDYVAYDPWLDAPLPTLTTLTLGDPTPVMPDTVSFTLTFSRLMDPAIAPVVTFSPSNPLEGNTVAADTGWAADSLTWTGSFVFTDTTGDGPHTISVSGARDVWGWAMESDTTHSFFLDSQAPGATASSPAISAQDTFLVSWTAMDPAPGSGIFGVDVYVSEDDSAWTLWLPAATDTSALYPGQDGFVYYFYAAATDSAGNMESAAAAECTTEVDSQAPAIPALLTPADGAVLADTAADFSWSRVVKAAGGSTPARKTRKASGEKATPVEYRLQCATSDLFDSLLVDEEGLTDTTYAGPVLGDGMYFWRVSASDGAGHQSGFPATPFSFQLDTEAPVITATSVWPDTTFLGPFEVITAVDDESEVGPVLLWYRTSLDTVLRADTMETMEDKGGYTGEIPEQAAVDSVLVEYYIETQDVATPSNTATDPPGAPEDSIYAFMAYGPVSVDGQPGDGVPTAFMLEQNYPNPFNAQTVFRYHIPARNVSGGGVPVQLAIYNVRGQRVRVLVDDLKTPGRYQAVWDGTDSEGRPVSSGIYLSRLQAGGRIQIRKAILLR